MLRPGCHQQPFEPFVFFVKCGQCSQETIAFYRLLASKKHHKVHPIERVVAIF